MKRHHAEILNLGSKINLDLISQGERYLLLQLLDRRFDGTA